MRTASAVASSMSPILPHRAARTRMPLALAEVAPSAPPVFLVPSLPPAAYPRGGRMQAAGMAGGGLIRSVPFFAGQAVTASAMLGKRTRQTGGRVMARKPPRKKPAVDLAEKLVQVLESRRGLGPDSYPPSLQQLAAEADPQAAPDLVEQAVKAKPFKDRALLAPKAGSQTPVALAEDAAQLADSPRLLEVVLERLCTPDARTWSLAKVSAEVSRPLKKPFEE